MSLDDHEACVELISRELLIETFVKNIDFFFEEMHFKQSRIWIV